MGLGASFLEGPLAAVDFRQALLGFAHPVIVAASHGIENLEGLRVGGFGFRQLVQFEVHVADADQRVSEAGIHFPLPRAHGCRLAGLPGLLGVLFGLGAVAPIQLVPSPIDQILRPVRPVRRGFHQRLGAPKHGFRRAGLQAAELAGHPRDQVTAAGIVGPLDALVNFQRALRQIQRPLVVFGGVVQRAQLVQGGELPHVLQADAAAFGRHGSLGERDQLRPAAGELFLRRASQRGLHEPLEQRRQMRRSPQHERAAIDAGRDQQIRKTAVVAGAAAQGGRLPAQNLGRFGVAAIGLGLHGLGQIALVEERRFPVRRRTREATPPDQASRALPARTADLELLQALAAARFVELAGDIAQRLGVCGQGDPGSDRQTFRRRRRSAPRRAPDQRQREDQQQHRAIPAFVARHDYPPLRQILLYRFAATLRSLEILIIGYPVLSVTERRSPAHPPG